MAEKKARQITDVETLKALGHPLRMKLFRAVYAARTATASQLAQTVNEAVSLVSYHLRTLAKHGLIEEAEGQGSDGRERWWKPAAQSLTISDEDFIDEPGKAAAHRSVTRLFQDQRAELYARYVDEKAAWGAEWRKAAFDSEYLPRLTAPELASLSKELDAVLRKYDEAGRAAEAAGETEGREQIAVHLYGFPFRP
ncbi:helix-turn-helix transcriptional regulator [Streptomyces sp. YC504]|uniref:Helix-turn-helix transcriptional regulator n=1 Tax=Streptomyces mesophilus TaxID=1775132 RepID=A0A6G4XRS9_9ACTN|nr:helix-turn-helix domain-containing protein [Streptomyces mesophilus]NGO80148.1 helix-turn-helix transcriptional regulator [Streptomyces mesophilus]